MLTTIQIDNFAIIDHLEVDFQPGMTVLTGETGAGKSIIVDALSLVLGDRADPTVVRNNCKQADITATFDISQLPEINQWLTEHELSDQNDCLLRRIISKEGRSKAYINGHPATLSMMKSLGEQLVDIHGQHAHQALLRPGMQSRLLDNFANHNKLLGNLSNHWNKWQLLVTELQKLQHSEQERHDRHELLDYQVSELARFGISTKEISTIDEDFNRLANSNQLLEETSLQLHNLYQNEGQSAFEIVNQATASLEQLSEMDKSLSPVIELLHGASIQIQEASQDLRAYQQQLEMDPEKLKELDQRLSQLHDLARKHRIEVKELPELQIRLVEELEALTDSTRRLDGLEQEVISARNAYLDAAAALSKSRHQAAKKLNKAISNYLTQLGMSGGQFAVNFDTLDEERYNSEGTEKITFLVTANPGQPLQPLTKVASGGELSRISLAIQVVTVADSSIPCLIFDEVDVGIGGGTAEVVGNLLNEISAQSQVLCVTHQAQVAAKGNQHYRVIKTSSNKKTSTYLEDLQQSLRTEEIARMIGGIEITEQTRNHAREMLVVKFRNHD
ncbi:MAG: DNA repair protein RecN [Gammaproteobacteria bacterium]|nr:DNA repair protein RecN [Gammaproteobacteria bacterium]